VAGVLKGLGRTNTTDMMSFTYASELPSAPWLNAHALNAVHGDESHKCCKILWECTDTVKHNHLYAVAHVIFIHSIHMVALGFGRLIEL